MIRFLRDVIHAHADRLRVVTHGHRTELFGLAPPDWARESYLWQRGDLTLAWADLLDALAGRTRC